MIQFAINIAIIGVLAINYCNKILQLIAIAINCTEPLLQLMYEFQYQLLSKRRSSGLIAVLEHQGLLQFGRMRWIVLHVASLVRSRSHSDFYSRIIFTKRNRGATIARTSHILQTRVWCWPLHGLVPCTALYGPLLFCAVLCCRH